MIGADLIAGFGIAVAGVTIVEELPVRDELERGSSLPHTAKTMIARIPMANIPILITIHSWDKLVLAHYLCTPITNIENKGVPRSEPLF